MITPDAIRRKAANLYSDFVKAWLTDEAQTFFPHAIRSDRQLARNDAARNITEVEQLKTGSKETQGKGYSVEWEERASRLHGRNQFPKRIMIETADDLLWLAGKQRDFERFSKAVLRLRKSFPELKRWVASHTAKLTELADDVEGLVAVADYFQTHPRPGMFARELPIPVPTKFIEWNQSVLREWLDIILPPVFIEAHEEQFERRYGLRYVQPHFLTRTLDEELRGELGLPFAELSLPAEALSSLPVRNTLVFIVENRVNALTLPPVPRALVLGGLGDGVTLLRRVSWLPQSRVYYWGDIDAEGFEALASLRAFCAEVRSLFMDAESLARFAALASRGTGVRPPKSLNLNEQEAAAYHRCCAENLRIEQERILQASVVECVDGLLKPGLQLRTFDRKQDGRTLR